jgi:hypothetical protein
VRPAAGDEEEGTCAGAKDECEAGQRRGCRRASGLRRANGAGSEAARAGSRRAHVTGGDRGSIRGRGDGWRARPA